MSNYYDYTSISSLMKDKSKTLNKNIKIKDNDLQKYKIKLSQEKEKIPLDNNIKVNKNPKNNINEKKENGIEYEDTPNPDKEEKKDKSDNINDILNQMLSQKETKLLTDSQYVSFDNFIGDNSCYVNVIMHFLYLFPCVNDFLIKKYQEKLKQIEKEKANQKEKQIETPKEKEKEAQKGPEKEEQKETQKKEESNSESKKDSPTPTQISKEIVTKKPEDGISSIDKKKKKKDELNDFLFNLGKILNSYQEILAKNDSKFNITNLNTIDLRKSLSICSDNKFKLNCISDPVEFLIYILDIINKENSEEIHLYFHLKLIEEVRCMNFCPFKSNRKYDKDNFIYQIYVEEIFNYIKNQKLTFDDFRDNLFMLSYYSLQNEMNTCQKCNSIKNKILICNNEDGTPKFLLVNCVWNNVKPDLKEVIKFLYFISLIEQLDNLFLCPSKNEKSNYYLHGIIFYSFTLCHYINLIFNLQKNVFTLYNDTGIMEFDNMNEVYNYITKEQLKKNNKAYFYPVLLVYGKENIYDEKILMKLKRTNKINYEILLEECDKLVIKTKDKPKDKPLTKEEIDKNMRELMLAQIKFERQSLENKYLNKDKESDEIYSYLMNENNNGNGGLKRLNIINNNEPKKNKIGINNNTNGFLHGIKDNKKVNKSSSLDKRFTGLANNQNKLYNPYNVGHNNYGLPKRTTMGTNGYRPSYGYNPYEY